MVTFRTLFRRSLGFVVGVLFLAMIWVMLSRPELYPTWTVVMMGFVAFISFWYGFRDAIPY